MADGAGHVAVGAAHNLALARGRVVLRLGGVEEEGALVPLRGAEDDAQVRERAAAPLPVEEVHEAGREVAEPLHRPPADERQSGEADADGQPLERHQQHPHDRLHEAAAAGGGNHRGAVEPGARVVVGGNAQGVLHRRHVAGVDEVVPGDEQLLPRRLEPHLAHGAVVEAAVGAVRRLPRLLRSPEVEDRRVHRRLQAFARDVAEPVLRGQRPARVALQVAVVEVPPHLERLHPPPVERVPGVLLDAIGDVVVGTVPLDDPVPGLLGAAGLGVEHQNAGVEVALGLRRQDALLPDLAAGVVAKLVVFVGAGDKERLAAVPGKVELEERRDVGVEEHVDVEVDHVAGRVGDQHRGKDRRPGKDVPARAWARRDGVGVGLERLLDVDVAQRRAGEAADQLLQLRLVRGGVPAPALEHVDPERLLAGVAGEERPHRRLQVGDAAVVAAEGNVTHGSSQPTRPGGRRRASARRRPWSPPRARRRAGSPA